MTKAAIILGLFATAGFIFLLAINNLGQREKRLAKRLNLIAETMQRTDRPPAPSRPRTRLRQYDILVRRIFSFGMARTWAMKANTAVLMTSAALCSAGSWLATVELAGLSFTPALLAGALGFLLAPRFLLARQQRRAEAAFTEAFPDTVDSVTRMLQAGMPVASALRSIANDAAEPISGVFGKIADQTNIGVSISDALDASSRQIGLPDFRFFAVAIILQSATGGNLVSTLEKLSEIMRKRRAVRKKAKAVTSEVRFAAYLLGALPFVTVGVLLVIQPDYLVILFADTRGRVILWSAAALLGMTALSIRAMMGSIRNV